MRNTVSRGRGGGLGTLGTLIQFLKGSRGDPLRLPGGRSRPTPPKSLQPPPPPPPSLKRLSLGKCLDKLLSHYLLSKVCFWILLLPREGSRVTIPDCSILLSMPLCNTLKNIDLEQARYHPEANLVGISLGLIIKICGYIRIVVTYGYNLGYDGI